MLQEEFCYRILQYRMLHVSQTTSSCIFENLILQQVVENISAA